MPTFRATTRAAVPRKSMRPRWRIGWAIAALFCLGLFALLAAVWAATRTPEFYVRATDRDAVRPERQGDELERRTLELRNAARRPGDWTYVIDEDELNGWLTRNLSQEFPRALPESLGSPRVSIGEEGIRVGCVYRESRFEVVLSVEVDVYLTEDSRSVAIEFRSLRAGLLPLPMDRLLVPLQEATRKQEAPVRWSQTGRRPMALWTIPERPTELGGRRVTLERIELRAGQLVAIGRSE